jgi:methyl-accepting chemotaxis protein
MFRTIKAQIAVALVPSLVMAGVLVVVALAAAATQARAERQRRATHEFVRGLQQLADDVRRHRTASQAVLGGDTRFGGDSRVDSPLMQLRKEIGDGFAALDADPSAWAFSAALAPQWHQLRNRWEYIRAYHLFRTADESNELHIRLQSDLMALASQADNLAGADSAVLAKRRSWLLLAAGGLLFGLVLTPVLAFGAAGHIHRQLQSVTDVCAGVEQGHYAARVPVRREDEVGDVADSVNRVLDLTQDLSLFRDAHNRLQASLLLMLEDLHRLAEGDLSHEANSLSDLPAALAEGFGALIHHLRHTVGAAQVATLQLSTSAKHAQLLIADLAQESEGRTEDAGRLGRLVGDMGGPSQQVAQHSAAAAGAVEQAAAGIRGGNTALRSATEAVNSLRARLEVAARHTRRLGEDSPEVAATLSHLEELVRWSQLMARGGESNGSNGTGGLGAALAEGLATRATDATRYLSGVTALHEGLRRVSASLDEVSRDAVHGTLLTFQAGQATLAAETSVQQLALLRAEIATAVRQQTELRERLVKTVDSLGQGMQKELRDSRQAALILRDLAKLAEQAHAALAVFRVPDDGTGVSSVLSVDGSATIGWASGEEEGEHPVSEERGEVVEALSKQ